jgi:hypothetical protein
MDITFRPKNSYAGKEKDFEGLGILFPGGALYGYFKSKYALLFFSSPCSSTQPYPSPEKKRR